MDSFKLGFFSDTPQSIYSLPVLKNLIPDFGKTLDQPLRAALLAISLTGAVYLFRRTVILYLADDVRKLKGPVNDFFLT